MNRSYSKKRHIQEVNDRLEKRFLNEKTIITESGWDLLYATPLGPLKLAYDIGDGRFETQKTGKKAGKSIVKKIADDVKSTLAKAGAKKESIEKWGNYFCVPIKAQQLGISPDESNTGSITYTIDGYVYFDNGKFHESSSSSSAWFNLDRFSFDSDSDYHCQDLKIVHSKGKTKVSGGGGKSKWDSTCDGGESKPFKKMCKGETIRKVQGCLGIKADSYFGSETETAINNKIGKKFFTNADIDKLCGTGGQTPPKPTDSTQKPEEAPFTDFS